MQTTLNEPLAKAANGGLIGHGFGGIQLDELLKTQPVLNLFFNLRVAQAVEMLQIIIPQQHTDPAGGPPACTIRGRTRCSAPEKSTSRAMVSRTLLPRPAAAWPCQKRWVDCRRLVCMCL